MAELWEKLTVRLSTNPPLWRDEGIFGRETFVNQVDFGS